MKDMKKRLPPLDTNGLGRTYPAVIAAFRHYARLGLDRDEAPPYIKYERIRGCSRSEKEAAVLLAVCDTLRILRLTGRSTEYSAVRQVWLGRCYAPLGKQEISLRVRKAALLLFCDDRTIYRYLRSAADLFTAILKESGYTI